MCKCGVRSSEFGVKGDSEGRKIKGDERGHFRIQEQVVEKQDAVVKDMVKMALGALAMNGVLVSEHGREALYQAIFRHVTQSVEIEATIAMNIARGDGPRAA